MERELLNERGKIEMEEEGTHKEDVTDIQVPYRTRTVLLANLKSASSVPLIAQRTRSSIRFDNAHQAFRAARQCWRSPAILVPT